MDCIRGSLHMRLVALAVSCTLPAQGQPGVGLIEAANLCDAAAVQALLDKGIDVNAVNRLGNTALMEASSNGCLRVVQLLLDKHADVNVKNHAGQYALLLAAQANHEEVVTLLSKASSPAVESAETYTALLERYVLDAAKSLKAKGYYLGDAPLKDPAQVAAALEKFQHDKSISETITMSHPITDKALGIAFNPTNACYWRKNDNSLSLECPAGCKTSLMMSSSVASGGTPRVVAYQVSCPGQKDKIFGPPSN